MCLYGDCITSEPAVLVSLDALRYSDSNEMCSSPFCCQTATCTLFISSNILGVHVLTGCDTMLPLSDKGINTCWKIAIKYANLLSGVVRYDNVDDAWAFVCSLYGIGENDVRGNDEAMHSIFVKAKSDLDVLPTDHDALELHITRAKYQVKIWLQADHVIMDLEKKLKLLTCGKKVQTD